VRESGIRDSGELDDETLEAGESLQVRKPVVGDFRPHELQFLKPRQVGYMDELLIGAPVGEVNGDDTAEIVNPDDTDEPFRPGRLPIRDAKTIPEISFVFDGAAGPLNRAHRVALNAGATNLPC